MPHRWTFTIAAVATLAAAGAVSAPSAFAAKHHHHPAKHRTTKPNGTGGLTKAQVLAIIQQYLAAHPAPTTSTSTPGSTPTPAPTYTAGPGLKLTNNAFSFDPAVVQARETANCPANEFLQGLGVTGAPSCSFALAPAIGTSSNVTLSAIRAPVASATASAGGHQLVFAQVEAHRLTANPGDSIGCVLNDITAAPGTDYDVVVATFPAAGGGTSYVDLPLQSVIPSNPGDTIAVSCTGGAAGYAVDVANIALLPLA